MTTVRLGRTELVVGKQSFGCLPIQRITKEEAVALLRRAYEDRKSTRLNSSHEIPSRMPSSA